MLLKAGEAVATEGAAAAREDQELRPGVVVPLGDLVDLGQVVQGLREGRLAEATEVTRAFTAMRANLPVELHETLETLQARCEENQQFAVHERLHKWLHYWLALHIPFSAALLVLFVVHVVVSLRVVPWAFPFKL